MPDSSRRNLQAVPPEAEPGPLAPGPPKASRAAAGGFPVVGIGASAGGLDACRKFLSALPDGHGMAFILVQHLDPTHESMMVDLLTGHTAMTVRQATDGMPIQPNHLAVIPPGSYLSVVGGALRLSEPQARHGARLPFDFLLLSMANEFGPRAFCVILSGTGGDGSAGLRAIKEHGGLVIAQEPDDAGYGGMPRSAILTGVVDLVLPVSDIPDALVAYARRMSHVLEEPVAPPGLLPEGEARDGLTEIVDVLRTRTAYDFTFYKQGTLQRRIERRMAMAGIEIDDIGRYLGIVKDDAHERDFLAKDLLINVTSFFRDPKVFELLSAKIIPELITAHPPDQPIRIWIAGCSTGEETYSLAMLFREAISVAGRAIKLQLFASDVDPDAVASAREGLYPTTIEADVSPARLARFFTKEERGYRILAELRATVVFTVQDVLADPPFSRIDFVSCRNLLIYLRPEAQAKVLALFHFALRKGGILLIGSSETIAKLDGRFEVLSKVDRIYRHIGQSRPGDIGFALNAGDAARSATRVGALRAPSRQVVLADLCRRLVMETYAPAAVLINVKNECLFSLGPTDRYLRVAPGFPTHDLLAMAGPGIRTKLRSAIHQAGQDNARVEMAGGRAGEEPGAAAFRIAVQPVRSEGESLFVVCFVDDPKPEHARGHAVTLPEAPRVEELEQELESTRTELQGAIRSLEISIEDQKSVNEEALSVNEEFQSTNEELLTSKEELQSLNEELTALNSQLHETLEKQRTTSNDLQNVLNSTDVATVFLDTHLNIRFFTPATRALFGVLPGDIGRPLADLSSLSDDASLLTDAQSILSAPGPIEREIRTHGDVWFTRRVLPYRTHDDAVEGVVITYTDVTERKRASHALELAKQSAENANAAKSRFLAAASHDLRQPLQTLSLIHALLAKKVENVDAKRLVGMLDPTLSAMSGMLNTLLDINQIDAGAVQAEACVCTVSALFERLTDEFRYQTQARGLTFHVVPSTASVVTDLRLLEQMIRNLLSNALKYTLHGKILLGCRRMSGLLSIQIWDSGIGIAPENFDSIFEEFSQVDNAARERNKGLGLGLPIVRRLGELLGHRVRVMSWLGKGSMFAVDVATPVSEPAANVLPGSAPHEAVTPEAERRSATILVVDDDPDLRELLELLLRGEGHTAATAPDGAAALDMVSRGLARPDLILADYNLPNGMNGLQTVLKLREKLHRQVPVIILTGDISTDTLRDIGGNGCIQLNKPVRPDELTGAIQHLLPPPPAGWARHAPLPAGAVATPTIYVVDDDAEIRELLRVLLESDGRTVLEFPSCEAFLDAYRPGGEACLLLDGYLPGMHGLELLERLAEMGERLPVIMITGSSDVSMVVRAMKAGAADFIEKPIGGAELLASVARSLEQARDAFKLKAWRQNAAEHVASLTARQHEIMTLVLAGHPSKNIAADLGISQRTVENHRAAIMEKTGSKSLPALARLALAAASNEAA